MAVPSPACASVGRDGFGVPEQVLEITTQRLQPLDTGLQTSELCSHQLEDIGARRRRIRLRAWLPPIAAFFSPLRLAPLSAGRSCVSVPSRSAPDVPRRHPAGPCRHAGPLSPSSAVAALSDDPVASPATPAIIAGDVSRSTAVVRAARLACKAAISWLRASISRFRVSSSRSSAATMSGLSAGSFLPLDCRFDRLEAILWPRFWPDRCGRPTGSRMRSFPAWPRYHRGGCDAGPYRLTRKGRWQHLAWRPTCHPRHAPSHPGRFHPSCPLSARVPHCEPRTM